MEIDKSKVTHLFDLSRNRSFSRAQILHYLIVRTSQYRIKVRLTLFNLIVSLQLAMKKSNSFFSFNPFLSIFIQKTISLTYDPQNGETKYCHWLEKYHDHKYNFILIFEKCLYMK